MKSEDKQLRIVTDVPLTLDVALIELAELGYVRIEMASNEPWYPGFDGYYFVSISNRSNSRPLNALSPSHLLVMHTLFGEKLPLREVALTDYAFPKLAKALEKQGGDTLQQMGFAEPTSFMWRLLAMVLALGATVFIATQIWEDSSIGGFLLVLMGIFICVVILREPRGWQVSDTGRKKIAAYREPASFAKLSVALRHCRRTSWTGLTGPAPAWLLCPHWSGDPTANEAIVARLVACIKRAGAPTPPPAGRQNAGSA